VIVPSIPYWPLESHRRRICVRVLPQLLEAFRARIASASTGDVVLVLATVARLGHVTSYAWMEEVVEGHLLPRLPAASPKELASVRYLFCDQLKTGKRSPGGRGSTLQCLGSMTSIHYQSILICLPTPCKLSCRAS
jgi:hypothetical protein